MRHEKMIVTEPRVGWVGTRKYLTSMLALLLAVGLAGTVSAATIVMPVAPEGDGQFGRGRYGFSYGWEDIGFTASANPGWAGHWYDSGSANGESSHAYLQVALPALSDHTAFQSAWLYLHITECTYNGSSIRHRTDSSTAIGLASQRLTGNTTVMDLTPAAVGGLGWLAINVTDQIGHNLAEGHAYAVFDFPAKSNSSMQFNTGDDVTGLAPYLSITMLPEPTSFVLLAVGGLMLMRRRF